MHINDELNRSSIVNTNILPWVSTAEKGVQRRLIERNGGEVARATTLVRYAPNSGFHAHRHDLGEEFLVLKGVFSDESGDYPEGMYVRNPPGSRHQPFTRHGCTIFVKLRQFSPDDTRAVRIDTRRLPWDSSDTYGISMLHLHEFRHETVTLEKWQAGTTREPRENPGGEEIFIIKGVLQDGEQKYRKGYWIRSTTETTPPLSTSAGCLLFVKRGHLPA